MHSEQSVAYRIALSAGYQRSPFLSAGNAVIGEFDLDLDNYLDRLDSYEDIYDAALDRTALNSYGSLVLNHELRNGHRLIAEVCHFELSDLPVYDFSPDAPDSEVSTTLGIQYVWPAVFFQNDTLSTGMRATQRTVSDYDQDALTLRPRLRLDWYITRDLMLESELGYEWLMQDFGREDFEVQQGFGILGLRRRF